MSNYFEYVASIMPQLLLGLKVTLQMTVVSLALAVVVAEKFFIGKAKKDVPLNKLTLAFMFALPKE